MSNDDPAALLAAMEAAARKATPGPWSHSASRGQPGSGFEAQVWDADGMALLFFADNRTIGTEADANAAFIATANPAAVLQLCTLLREAQAREAQAVAALETVLRNYSLFVGPDDAIANAIKAQANDAIDAIRARSATP